MIYSMPLARLVSEVLSLPYPPFKEDESEESYNKRVKKLDDIYKSQMLMAQAIGWVAWLRKHKKTENLMCQYFTNRVGSIEPITQLIIN